MEDVEQFAPQSKPRKPQTNSRWFAVCKDVFDHPIVGMDVQPPAAEDRSRAAMFPFMIWVWMCGKAAYREHEVVVKDQYLNLARGQLVVSERYLAKKANWTRKAARLFLFRLARHGMVQLSSVQRDGQMLLDFHDPKRVPGRVPPTTIVTICNYDVYQRRLHVKGTAEGTSKGPARYQISTINNLTIRQSVSQSPRDSLTKESNQSGSAGTDWTDEGSNVVPLRKPMPLDAPGAEFKVPAKTRQSIETLGCDPEALLDRMYEQIDKGRRIGSKARYLVKSALNEAHERDGTPIEVLKAMISGNKFAREAAIVAAAAGAPKPASPAQGLIARTAAPKSSGSALLAALAKRG